MIKKIIVGILAAIPATLLVLWASEPNAGGDWPMWGGTPDRNMVSNMKAVPTSWVRRVTEIPWLRAAWFTWARTTKALGTPQ